MLPYCEDDVLLDELANLITAGSRLPDLPDSAQRLPHLLLLQVPERAEPYRTRADRLLRLLDEAIQGSQLGDGPGDELSHDEQYGLRILLGVHPDYRGASVTTRRENGAEYLVPEWRGRTDLTDRAETFRRRHQQRAVALLLRCLRATYGQEPRPSEFEEDHLWEDRLYRVNNERQVYEVSSRATIQSRVDDLQFMYIYQHGSVLEGFDSQEFVGLETADGPTEVVALETTDQVDGPDFVTLQLPKALHTGEIGTYGWRQTITYNAQAPRWKRGFVMFGARNDDFGFDLRVAFDAQQPESLWWFEDLPVAEHVHGPVSGQELPIDRLGTAHRRREPPTNRGTAYGMAWKWLEDWRR